MLGTLFFAVTETHASGSDSGFPLFDVGNAASLIFWGGLVFLLFYFVLAPILIDRSEKIIEDRESTISGDLDAAEVANATATQLLAEYEAKMETARSEASSAVRDVLEEAKSKAISAENRVSKKIAKNAADADDRINAALSKATDDLTNSAAVTAQATVARLAGLKVTKDMAKKAVQAST